MKYKLKKELKDEAKQTVIKVFKKIEMLLHQFRNDIK